MFKIDNLFNNANIKVLDHKGMFAVIEYVQDKSVNKGNAIVEFFASKMNVRRRQVVCFLKNQGVVVQSGAMQWMLGDIDVKTGIKGVGDLLGKFAKAKVTKESTVKPEYFGNGYVVLEPSYKYLILVDLNEWNNDLVIEDGMFYACDADVQQKINTRGNLSSAALGGEGLFNLNLQGKGIVCLESNYPREELIEIQLNNDVLKIDGDMAVMWSGSLDFTVEKTTKTFIGSAASGEGFVNVYRGTGKVLLSPVSR